MTIEAAVGTPTDDQITLPPGEIAEVPEDHGNEVADPSLEARARRMGWRPKEEFRGDPNRWTDAKAFIERGESELPVLRERYRALDDRFARTESELKEVKSVAKEASTRLDEVKHAFGEFREFSRRSEERAYLRAKTEIEAKMAAAVEIADTRAYNQARGELDVLESTKPDPATETRPASPPPPPPPPAPPQVDPVVQAWVNDNASWFHSDGAMRAYATEVHGTLLRDKPGMSMSENLDEVKRDVMLRFPEKFGNQRRAAPAAVAAPAAPATRSKKKTLADMSAEERAAFARFKKMMPDYTEEEYLKTYFAGDEK